MAVAALTAGSTSAFAKDATCFGETARVVDSSSDLRIKRGAVLLLKNRAPIKVSAAGRNLICATGNTVRLTLGGGGSSKVRLGSADDRVLLHGTIGRKQRRTIWTGLGNDSIKVTDRGHTIAYLSPKLVKPGARDTDTYSGNQDIDTVYDWGGGADRRPNVIEGNRALDYLHSGGTARSNIHGGDGTDYLFAASRGDGKDRLFGERGNDRLDLRSKGRKSNGAYMDGAEGDDWYFGSSGPDTMVALSGIKKIYGGAGNDKIIRTAIGKASIYGGAGRDTLSYMGQVPPGFNDYTDGVRIKMAGDGTATAGSKGKDIHIGSIEHLIGSAYDDHIQGRIGKVHIYGGPGNDFLVGERGNTVDGGFGRDGCAGHWKIFETFVSCGANGVPEVPDPFGVKLTILDDGVLVVRGTELSEQIDVAYSMRLKGFLITTDGETQANGLCQSTSASTVWFCPAGLSLLSIAVVSGGPGDDNITLHSIPEQMNMIVDGDLGVDSLKGSGAREVTFGIEKGHLGKGNDQIWMAEDSTLNAGPGSDTVHMTEFCIGGYVKGGPGIRDGIVFAGLRRGVWASMEDHVARYMKGPCEKPFRFADDWEGLEGTKRDDVLIGSPDRGITFLGRSGIDVFKARNGKFDKITVGDGGKKNTVIADPKDRIHWDWGYAAF